MEYEIPKFLAYLFGGAVAFMIGGVVVYGLFKFTLCLYGIMKDDIKYRNRRQG